MACRRLGVDEYKALLQEIQQGKIKEFNATDACKETCCTSTLSDTNPQYCTEKCTTQVGNDQNTCCREVFNCIKDFQGEPTGECVRAYGPNAQQAPWIGDCLDPEVDPAKQLWTGEFQTEKECTTNCCNNGRQCGWLCSNIGNGLEWINNEQGVCLCGWTCSDKPDTPCDVDGMTASNGCIP